jgi:hypothetical protein
VEDEKRKDVGNINYEQERKENPVKNIVKSEVREKDK